jgi:peptide/nickel transport system substrate-binding protein
MHIRNPLRLAITAVAVAAFTLIGHSGVGSAASKATITFAEAPGANPNYIFPYLSCAFSSVNNINQFQMLMYRPLYWFGRGGSPDFIPSLSPANRPVFSHANQTVTITMKGWKFADGQAVNARSVMFFLNMYKADPISYCGYNAGYGIPDQVKSASGRGNTVRINFTSPVNPRWILSNYLSEITPMADRWDRTAANKSSSCATGPYGDVATIAACKAVESYLNSQSLIASTYTNQMWQGGVDGPWRLTSFDQAGNATFQPNPRYSGPQKAQVRFVKEVAYTSAQAEESDLLAGKLSIGYINPGVLASSAPAPGKVGANWGPLAAHYSITTGSTWSFNFASFNFSPTDAKSVPLSQLYIRQALQYAIDQAGIIQHVYKGYGSPIYSPLPPNTPKTISAPITNPYPFNLEAALTLLSAHGWTMQNGVQTCTDPGTGPTQCGANIPLGYQLSFNVVSAGGSPTLDQTLNTEIANWQVIGIQINHSTATFNNVISDCSGSSGFEICAWGTGWSYPPSYYPSGESLFVAGADFNVGAYSNPQMTALVKATIGGSAGLSAYAAYAAKQLPVLYQPQANVIGEVDKSLKSSVGLSPNPLGNFMPEYLRF